MQALVARAKPFMEDDVDQHGEIPLRAHDNVPIGLSTRNSAGMVYSSTLSLANIVADSFARLPSSVRSSLVHERATPKQASTFATLQTSSS